MKELLEENENEKEMANEFIQKDPIKEENKKKKRKIEKMQEMPQEMGNSKGYINTSGKKEEAKQIVSIQFEEPIEGTNMNGENGVGIKKKNESNEEKPKLVKKKKKVPAESSTTMSDNSFLTPTPGKKKRCGLRIVDELD